MVLLKDSYGVLSGDGVIDIGMRFGDRWPSLRAALAAGALAEIRNFADGRSPDHATKKVGWRPVLPDCDKVMCIGRNYKDHLEETGAELPPNPRVFLKHRTAIVAHNEPIVRPRLSDKFDYEGELTVVIGRAGRHIPADRALDHVAGYTLLNDASVRDYQQHSLFAGKNFERDERFWSLPHDYGRDPGSQQADAAHAAQWNRGAAQRNGHADLRHPVPDQLSLAIDDTVTGR